MFSPSRQPLPRRLARAFTLIELLVVVAIIATLAGAISYAYKGGSRSEGLRSGQRALVAAVEATKASAALEGVPARLIIYADSNQVQSNNLSTVGPKRLRYFGVIHQAKSMVAGPNFGQPLPQTWTADSSGEYLPEGIYFVPAQPSQFATNLPILSGSGNVSALVQNADLRSSVGTMHLPFPESYAREGDAGSEIYYFIEFAPNGLMTYADPTIANLIVASADQTQGDTVNFNGTNNLMLSGVQVRYLGGVLPFHEAADITGPTGGQ